MSQTTTSLRQRGRINSWRKLCRDFHNSLKSRRSTDYSGTAFRSFSSHRRLCHYTRVWEVKIKLNLNFWSVWSLRSSELHLQRIQSEKKKSETSLVEQLIYWAYEVLNNFSRPSKIIKESSPKWLQRKKKFILFEKEKVFHRRPGENVSVLVLPRPHRLASSF